MFSVSLRSFVTAACILLSSFSLVKAEGVKFAAIDVQATFKLHPKTVLMEAEVKKRYEQLDDENKDALGDVRNLSATIRAKELALLDKKVAEDKVEEAREELTQLYDELNQLDRMRRDDMESGAKAVRKYQQQQTEKILKEILKAVEDYAKENDISYVFSKSQSPEKLSDVMFAKKKYDLTEVIAKKFTK